MIKKKYNDIGKEIKDGKTVEDKPDNDEKKRCMKEADWHETKSSLIFDFVNNDIYFGRSKPTIWKGNKRLTLPKASTPEMEALLDVRRRDAGIVYDECMRLLKDDTEKVSYGNITAGERRGVQSLRKRVNNNEIIICSTDKSRRFCVWTREDYQKAGDVHACKDREIDLDECLEVQRCLNGHMRWWGSIWNLGANWNQEDRSIRNLLNHGLAICPMTILIKDHKSWSVQS